MTARCSHSRYVSGCPGCRSYTASYDRYRRAAIAAGTWTPATPVEQIRDHITHLQQQGMSLTGIAAAAGLSPHTVYGVTNGKRRTVHGATAKAILAVTANPTLPAGMVPATGTSRRVRALVTAGYTFCHQARLLQTHMQQLWVWGHTPPATVTRENHQRVADLYTRLEDQPGPSARARNSGTRRGWPPPEAWLPGTIDDPDAQPVTGDGVDEVAIAKALARQLRPDQLHPVDRATLYHRLAHDQQLSHGQIRHRLGLSTAEVNRMHRTCQAQQPQLAAAG